MSSDNRPLSREIAKLQQKWDAWNARRPNPTRRPRRHLHVLHGRAETRLLLLVILAVIVLAVIAAIRVFAS